MIPAPRAVFLDVGGPIYDDENFVVAALGGLDELRAERGGPPVDRAAFRTIYDRVRAAQSGSLRTALAAELLGDPALRDELHARIAPRWVHPAGTLHADVLPFLAELRERGGDRIRIGVLANQEAATVEALRRDGVADFIDVWGISGIVGHEKPSPALFRWALAEAGAEPAEAVHIGNRLDTDVRPAHALGLRTVWVLRGEAPDDPTPGQLAEADLAVRSLDRLAEALLP